MADQACDCDDYDELPITYVRWKPYEDRIVLSTTLDTNHPMTPLPCIGCHQPLGTTQPVALIVIGPGDDEDARRKATEGRWGTSLAITVHAACAGISSDEETTHG